jgi:Ca-activated chloride channel homolog
MDMLADEEVVMPSTIAAQRSAGAPAAKFNSFGGGMIAHEPMPVDRQEFNTEDYDKIENADWTRVSDQPLSTFSIDVDTASYSNMRRFLNNGSLPPVDSVRIEEFVNYFDYDYEGPSGKHPFAVNFEQSVSPWNSKNKLVRIGVKGKEIKTEERPNSNFVFLLDVSGSMNDPNKLPLLKDAMKLLTRKLTEKDRVSIVVYAGASGLVLPSTPGDQKAKILGALTQLSAGGSTNGGQGIELAYKVAKENFIKGGINRVILATDGDFNVGNTSRGGLLTMIEEKAKSNIFLTVLGLGMGNYKDGTLEQLADKGNGNYAYLDTLNEAKKVLINDMDSTLITIAKDVKIQVEFNPSKVSAYRLIGYENRKLAAKDFNDDKKDAGEIGAGHTVTAFYEVVPAGVEIDSPSVDALKYQRPKKVVKGNTDELMTIKLRYKEPEGDKSSKLEFPLKDESKKFESASRDYQFAASVASFAMILRKDQKIGDMSIQKIIETAKANKGDDPFGYRQEFIENVELARELYKAQNQ